MHEEIQLAWEKLQDGFTVSQGVFVAHTGIYLLIGGLLALVLRFVYSHCSTSASDSEGVTRVFPLLTIVTTAVIAVVKSSLALSLGLVGALSIVRFRAAIKEPEELVYLFLCIAVGLSLGAEQPLLAVTLVVVSSLFAFGIHRMSGRGRRYRMMLTITGNAEPYFADGEQSVLAAVSQAFGGSSVHRLDFEDGRGQVRMMLPRTASADVQFAVAGLRSRFPDCEFSYVNMDSNL